MLSKTVLRFAICERTPLQAALMLSENDALHMVMARLQNRLVCPKALKSLDELFLILSFSASEAEPQSHHQPIHALALQFSHMLGIFKTE